eukprot:4047924-Prymnesium_polylepis.1
MRRDRGACRGAAIREHAHRCTRRRPRIVRVRSTVARVGACMDLGAHLHTHTRVGAALSSPGCRVLRLRRGKTMILCVTFRFVHCASDISLHTTPSAGTPFPLQLASDAVDDDVRVLRDLAVAHGYTS